MNKLILVFSVLIGLATASANDDVILRVSPGEIIREGNIICAGTSTLKSYNCKCKMGNNHIYHKINAVFDLPSNITKTMFKNILDGQCYRAYKEKEESINSYIFGDVKSCTVE